MKKYKFVFSIATIFGIFLLFVSGCEETRWDIAEDYNFKNIEPVVYGLSGPTLLPASGLSSARYEVNAREGSTYAWTVTGAPTESIETVTGYPGWADIKFSQSSVNIDSVVISVTETTSGGKTATAVMATWLTAFCPLGDPSELTGSYESDDDWGFPATVEFTHDGSDYNIKGLNDGWMVGYWGESITEEVAVTVTMNADGSLTIPLQYYMTTDWNGDPYRYEIDGVGQWDNCLDILRISYNIHYEGSSSCVSGSYCNSETVLTIVP